MRAFSRDGDSLVSTSPGRPLLSKLISTVAALACGATLAQPAEDVVAPPENEFAVWAGYGRSDNIGRVTIPESGSYRSVGFLAGLERETARLNAGIDANVEYRNYSLHVYDNETVGALDAHALVDLVEDLFAWNFQESFDQGQIDPFEASGPGNRETINVFTHGPQLSIPFDRTSLTFAANRSKRRYDESVQIDNDNDHYELAVMRQTSTIGSVGLVASTDQTEYVDGLTSEYEIERLFFRVNRTYRNGQLSADLGTNEIGSGPQSRRDPLVAITTTRMLSARSELRLVATRSFTDSGSQTQSPLGLPGTPANIIVTTAPFEQKNLELGYSLTQERTRFGLRFGVGEEDYAAEASLDHDFEMWSLSLDHDISRGFDIGFSYDFYERDFQGSASPGVAEEESTAGVWLSWALGRRFGLGLGVSRYERSGTTSVDENRTVFRFSYSPTDNASSAVASMGRW